jgi:hypothetical protein
VFKWLRDFPDFLNSYARARETQAELMAEQILAIADSADAESYNPARLQVDARKWLMSKLAPKKYGDATILKHADANGNQLEVQVTRVSPRPPKVIDVTPTAGARRRLPAADDGVARGTASEGAD